MGKSLTQSKIAFPRAGYLQLPSRELEISSKSQKQKSSLCDQHKSDNNRNQLLVKFPKDEKGGNNIYIVCTLWPKHSGVERRGAQISCQISHGCGLDLRCFTCSVTLGKSLNISEPQFQHLQISKTSRHLRCFIKIE